MRSNPVTRVATERGFPPSFLLRLLIFGSFALLIPGPLLAGESSHDDAAVEFLDLTEQVADLFLMVGMLGTDDSGEDLPLEVLQDLTSPQSVAEFKTMRVQPILTDRFTEIELRSLIEFFRSPVGVKLVEEIPGILSETHDAAIYWRKDALRSFDRDAKDPEDRSRAVKLPSEIVIGKDDLSSNGDSAEEFVAFDTPPEPIHMGPAEYPKSARDAGAEGEVLVLVTIDTDGTVVNAKVNRSDTVSELEDAAIEAAYKWTFKPARQGETPVKVLIIIPFKFSLD